MDLTKTGRFKKIGADSRVVHRKLSNPGILLRRRTGFTRRIKVRAREMRVPTGSVSGAARAVVSHIPIAKIVLIACLVAFASLGILIGVSSYAQSKQVNVRIESSVVPVPFDVHTTARTVRELLEQNRSLVGTLGPNDEVTPALNTRLSTGMVVMVNRAMIVFVTSGGKMSPVYLTGGTVEDALTKAQISCDQDDEVSPALDTKLTSGLKIKHVAVETDVITEQQSIDYTTIYKNSDTLLKGRTMVSQNGVMGIQQKNIQVTYRDGVEVSRTEISNVTSKEAINRIVLRGTGVATKPAGNKPSGNGGNTSTDNSNTGTSGIYSGIYASVKAEDLVIPSVPSHFDSILYMQITAYTHTGRKTACGNWPQFTRTLKKPGTIAVDPKAIPYGTLLYVTGYGYCVAEDTGANSVDSSKMGDVFMNTVKDCYNWGRRRNVTVYVVQSGFKR